MKKLVHLVLLGVALLGAVSVAFADGGDPIPGRPPNVAIK